MTLLRQDGYAGQAPELPNETELLLAAYRWQAGGKEDVGRLTCAIGLEVKGQLYEQLRLGCARALQAPASHLAIAREAIGQLIRDIGEDEAARRKAGAPHGAQTLLRPEATQGTPDLPARKVRDPSTGELFEMDGGGSAA